VVGTIPQGLPSFQLPVLDWEVIPLLLPAAFVMALIGFMEATSISRALAAQRREKLDANQELVGQGLANIVGSFFQSYTVSGSFSRSAVAARSGAQSGLFAVVSALGVLVTMLFLTPYLYHLPLAVLAAIVMSAVFGLLDFRTLVQAWKIHRADGAAGVLTFVVTLYMAPDLAMGVIVGVVLATLLFLMGTVRPRSEIQGLTPEGVLAGAISHDLRPAGDHFVVLRFDASLVFMNVAHFEEAVMEAVARNPNARALLVLGNSINRVDETGIDKVRSLITDLKAANCTLMFSGLKKPVREAMERAGLLDEIGPENIFPSKGLALEVLRRSKARWRRMSSRFRSSRDPERSIGSSPGHRHRGYQHSHHPSDGDALRSSARDPGGRTRGGRQSGLECRPVPRSWGFITVYVFYDHFGPYFFSLCDVDGVSEDIALFYRRLIMLAERRRTAA
jgi:sulfate permease, SulP family